eukprot:781272_1
MSQQLESARNRIEILVNESHAKSLKIEELKMEFRSIKNECVQINTLMENKDSLIHNKNTEMDDLRKRINELLDLLDGKDQAINEYEKEIKKLNDLKGKWRVLKKECEEIKIQKNRLSKALKSEKEVTMKLDDKLKATTANFSVVLAKDQEELNKLNKLLNETQKECTKKRKKAERLSNSLEDIKRNSKEESELLQDTIDRLRTDYTNLKKTNDCSKDLWEKRVKDLTKKLGKREDSIEERNKEIMKMSIDMAKIKSQVAMISQTTQYSSSRHA